MKNFRDLQVWTKAHELVKDVYIVSKFFPEEEIFGITAQLKKELVFQFQQI